MVSICSWSVTLAAIMVAQKICANPITDRREIEEVALQQNQATSSCPIHQYFSFNLKTCRECEIFCVDDLTEPNCKRQCAEFFLDKKWNDKFEKQEDEIEEIGEKGKENLNIWSILAVFIFVNIMVSIIFNMIWKWMKKSRIWHRIQCQDPLDKEFAELKAESEPQKKDCGDQDDDTRNNRNDNIIVPPKDDQQEPDVEGAPPSEQNKTFNSDHVDNANRSHGDNASVPPDGDVQARIDLETGPPAEKSGFSLLEAQV